MTRSVEIPNEAAFLVARQAALARWQTGSADTTQMLMSVDAALLAALPYLAPAGDGGLREALSAAVHEKSTAVVLEGGYIATLIAPEDAVAAVLGRLAAHPAAHAVSVDTAESTESTSAVPQPVDREALEDAIRDELLPSLGLELANPLSIDAADAVLAVLAGEQEQVET